MLWCCHKQTLRLHFPYSDPSRLNQNLLWSLRCSQAEILSQMTKMWWQMSTCLLMTQTRLNLPRLEVPLSSVNQLDYWANICYQAHSTAIHVTSQTPMFNNSKFPLWETSQVAKPTFLHNLMTQKTRHLPILDLFPLSNIYTHCKQNHHTPFR